MNLLLIHDIIKFLDEKILLVIFIIDVGLVTTAGITVKVMEVKNGNRVYKWFTPHQQPWVVFWVEPLTVDTMTKITQKAIILINMQNAACGSQ